MGSYLPPNDIRTVERSSLRVEPEERQTECICPVLSIRKDAAGQKNQRMAPISGGRGRSHFNDVELDVSTFIADPGQESTAVEITHSAVHFWILDNV